MSILKTNVEKIAHLARIALSDDEREKYEQEFEKILAFIEQINEIDTNGVEALANPYSGSLRLREDTVSEVVNCRDTTLALAPATEAGLYIVPKVIE